VYVQEARAYIMLVDPTRPEFTVGEDPTGDGTGLNVRALYQRCPHLGCKPNPCIKTYWLECACHGSRFDRVGTKADGIGPAPRGMDRFALQVDEGGNLTLDTGKITLGAPPIALGQPGLEAPRAATGCI
jgi:cytochrome b6-f complex iron-sulfur subunit